MAQQVGGPAGPIDFASLAAALLDRSHTLVAQWLPHGTERNGRWYVGDLDGGDGESANVNLATGQWIDNAAPDEDKGGDLISLYARVRGLNNGQAARELMRDLGWQRSAVGAASTLVRATAEAAPADAPKRRTMWRAIVPVPGNAPAPEFVFGYRDKHTDSWVRQQAVRTWAYRRGDALLGYVARFERTSSSGELVKDTVPLTWCVDESDSRGLQRWHWKTWEAPRPLYLAGGRLDGGSAPRPVLVVEGEKCADAAHELISASHDVVTWPGGCRTWALADWAWLQGRPVVLWPDVDAQRERLTKAEREGGADPEAKALLPARRQPGMAAMRALGARLLAEHGCEVRLCQVPEPGEVPAGWDVADAVAEGWDAARVLWFVAGAVPLDVDETGAADDAASASEGASTPALAGAGQGGWRRRAPGGADDAEDWHAHLLCNAKGSPLPVRDNLVLALDGVALAGGRWLPGVPEAQGVIAFNDFTNDVVKTRPTPWGTPAGVWDEVDELEMGHWLTRVHWLPCMPRGTLEEAVAMVAKRHRFHPVRDELAAWRGRWDGVARLATWLMRACLSEALAEKDLQAQYLARVGTWLVMAICARVLHPGCKFDYMTILEGAQGVGKSTLARLLGGEYFADTGLVLGDKDSYQNLQGVLVYEWGELDSLNRSEVTKVKQFISSQKDRFRASFDRRAKDYPRQCVFIGTTNEDHYLVDPTGNRRMWPVRVTRQIDVAWVAEVRAQLFAEAIAYVDAGKRMHPTSDEQRRLFEPQQQQRQIDNAIQAACLRYLYDSDQRMSMHGENGSMVNEITVQDLLSRVGITVEKQTHVIVRQATSALRHAGWELFRSTRGDRPRMFRRPDVRADEPAAGQGFNGATQRHGDGDRDGCPF